MESRFGAIAAMSLGVLLQGCSCGSDIKVAEIAPIPLAETTDDISELRIRALEVEKLKRGEGRKSLTTQVYERSSTIKAYVNRRAVRSFQRCSFLTSLAS